MSGAQDRLAEGEIRTIVGKIIRTSTSGNEVRERLVGAGFDSHHISLASKKYSVGKGEVFMARVTIRVPNGTIKVEP